MKLEKIPISSIRDNSHEPRTRRDREKIWLLQKYVKGQKCNVEVFKNVFSNIPPLNLLPTLKFLELRGGFSDDPDYSGKTDQKNHFYDCTFKKAGDQKFSFVKEVYGSEEK